MRLSPQRRVAERKARNSRNDSEPSRWPTFDYHPNDCNQSLLRLENLIDELSVIAEQDAKVCGDDTGSGKCKADGEPLKPEGSATQIEVPALSEKQYLILQTMLALNALSPDTRKTADEIAKAADGKQSDLNVFKPLLSDLTKKHKLTESKTGSGGGSWLTPLGIAVTNRVSENGKANLPKR